MVALIDPFKGTLNLKGTLSELLRPLKYLHWRLTVPRTQLSGIMAGVIGAL